MKAELFLVCLLVISQVQADIPVHCLKHQVSGEWIFEMDTPVAFAPAARDHTCGHELPDNADTSAIEMHGFAPHQTNTIYLNPDNSAHDDKQNKGTWTMVYDEGFDVTVNDVSYFAFSKFYKDGFDHKSDCSKTLLGWYHNTAQNTMGCFRGHKADGSEQVTAEVKHGHVVQPKDTQTDTTTELIKTDKKVLTTEPLSSDYHSSYDNYDFLSNSKYGGSFMQMDKDFDNHKHSVERLNNAGNSWTAKLHDQHQGLSLSELNSKAGIKRSGKSKRKTYPAAFETQDVSKLPKHFSWKEKLDTNRQQKDCGSCYIFATLQMLQARLKIKENDNVRLSVQHVVDCSVYNQGCDGGYPYLVNKFASEYELVPESCHSYQGETTGQCEKCDTSKLSKTYGVSDFKFIGGAYGKSNEKNMMKELQANGPIVASFEPGYDFMFYSNGVYHSPTEDSWVFEHETKPEWEKVDHSVLLYGWGETAKGEKYWNLQNTWGSDWGENGHFRMRRGVDDSAIESLAEASTPVVKLNNGSSEFFQQTAATRTVLSSQRSYHH